MARALWKGAISFGLVSIPVSLYPARSQSGEISFHMLHESDLSRVHNKRVDDKRHEVPFEDTVRGYEFDKGQYVVVGEADFEAASVEATRTIEIMHFVKPEEIDITYYDTPYYTEPAKAGRKAYALLRETLKRTGMVGVAKIVIRERQHLCGVVADGSALLAYTFRWPYQLRNASDFDLPSDDLDGIGVSPQEVKMARQLVQSMAADWQPDAYHDTYRDELLELIDQKVKSGKTTEVSERPKREAERNNVVDMMSLLKQSVEQRKSTSAAATTEESKAVGDGEPSKPGASGTKTRKSGPSDKHVESTAPKNSSATRAKGRRTS